MKKVYKLISLFLCLVIILTISGKPTKMYAFDKSTAKKNISVTYKKASNGVLAIYKNKNSYAVTLSGTLKFYDGVSQVRSKVTKKNNCLAAKKTATFFFETPRDEYGNPIPYSKYKGSFSVSSTKYKSAVDNITVNCEITPLQLQGASINSGKKVLKHIDATFACYDSDGNLVSCKTKSLNCFEPGTIKQFVVDYSMGEHAPSKCRVYINWAY